METFILLLIAMGFSWLSAHASVAYAIYVSSTSEGMIRFMLRDTYAMTVVGVAAWFLLGNPHMLMIMLIMRTIILLSTNWWLLRERYDEIKRNI